MKWNWFSGSVPLRRRGTAPRRRSRSAVLGVRRLERRRVLDASITSLTAMAPVVQNGDMLSMHEADPLKMTAEATGFGTLFFDWSLKRFDASHPNGEEIAARNVSYLASDQPQSDSFEYTPADDNEAGPALTLELRVSDAEQTFVTLTSTINVANLPPTVDLSGAGSVFAGANYELTIGPVNDPGADTVSQYIVHWGDSTSNTYSPADLGTNRKVNHVYTSAPATRTISIELVDEDGRHANADTQLVNVLVPPATIINFPDIPDLNEGSSFSVTATANGFGTLYFDWTLTEYDSAHQNPVLLAERHQTFPSDQPFGPPKMDTFSFMFPDDNEFNGHTFELELRVADSAQTFVTQTKTINVLNVDPDLELSGPASVNAGALYELTIGEVVDPGTDTVSQYIVHWGDSTTNTYFLADLGINRKVSHVYTSAPAARTITIDLVDEDGTFENVDSHLVNVIPVIPNATITNFPDLAAHFEGDTLSVTATATGFGTLFFDWTLLEFDAAHPAGVQIAESHATIPPEQLNKSHTFEFLLPDDSSALGHTFRLDLRVSDSAQTFDTEMKSLTVLNKNPTLTGTADLTLDEGELFTLASLGVKISDPGFDHLFGTETLQETFVVTNIDWGDGSSLDNVTVIGRLSPAGGPTTASFMHADHAYADDGDYSVTVTVRDDDGGMFTQPFTIHVDNVLPTLILTGLPLEVDEGSSLTISDLGSFSDPGFNTETFRYAILWGDGAMADGVPVPAQAVTDGMQGTRTMGVLSEGYAHLYLDNDADNLYQLKVRIADDNMPGDLQNGVAGVDFVEQQIDVFVRNKNPNLQPISATDLGTDGKTTLQLSFSDAGTDIFRIMVDWGDKLNLPESQRFVLAAEHDGTTPANFTLPHTYTGPPDPLHPTADITITVMILDDDAGIEGMVEPGVSQLRMATIANPGINTSNPAVDTTPDVPRLGVAAPPTTSVFIAQQFGTSQTLQSTLISVGGGDTVATTDRFLRLCVVRPDGRPGKCFRIKDEALFDLRGFFATLPDNRYQVFVMRTENNSQRLVIEVDVRRGHLVDPTDISEGTRDRPPTSEAAANNVVPLEQNPLLQQIFEPAQPGGGPAGGDPQINRELPRSARLLDPIPADVDFAAPAESGSNAAECACATVAAAGVIAWSKRLDLAFAEADDRSWQRLRRAGRIGQALFRDQARRL